MTSVPLERRGDYIVKMYELDEEVCRQMLTRCSFGRVAFGGADEGLTVLPVNCLFADDAVLFRAQAATALGASSDLPAPSARQTTGCDHHVFVTLPTGCPDRCGVVRLSACSESTRNRCRRSAAAVVRALVPSPRRVRRPHRGSAKRFRATP
jgi:hypothetical protein